MTPVCLTALLFGMTFSAVVARLDATLVSLDQLRSNAPRRHKIANVSLLWLVIPLFPLAVPAALYVAGRAILHDRAAPVINSPAFRLAGHAVVAVGTAAAAVAVIGALTQIV